MRRLLRIARNDLTVWRRSPLAVIAAIIPPLVMAVLLGVLVQSVSTQPVALVMDDHGPVAQQFEQLLTGDAEAYVLSIVDARTARAELASQQVAAVIVVPSDFDVAVAHDRGQVLLTLNNVDIDFSDDIRRTVERSVGQFDAPSLGVVGEQAGRSGIVLPNVYRVAVEENNLRDTTIDYLSYNIVPVIVLFVVNIGVLGTALVVAQDFERGTARLLLLAPLRRRTLITGRVLGGSAVTFAVLLPLIVVAVLGRIIAPPIGHWPAIAALLALCTVTAVGIGLLLGVALRRTRVVSMAAVTLATTLFLLGGGFTTIVFLPAWIQALSRIVPTTYVIEGLRQALFYPDLSGFGTDVTGIAVAAVVILALGAGALYRSWRRADA